MPSIALVDDEPEMRASLASMVARFATERGISLDTHEYADGREFLESGATEDVVFLDIEMNDLDGMATARRMREQGISSEIVFVTNMAQYAVEGYEVSALDFVVKPVQYPVFAFKLRRALEVVSRKRDARISITTREGVRHVNTADITYVEVIRHKLVYHTTVGTFEAWDSMKNVAQMLEPHGFALCNVSFLVNLDRVEGIVGDTVTVGGDNLKISRGKRREFLDALTLAVTG